MGYDSFWNEYELFFHHEFINDENFPIEKKRKLENAMGSFFIKRDFTIYQEKAKPYDEINKIDFERNYVGFIRILANIISTKIEDFLEFHYEKYPRSKKDFLTFVYHQVKGSKTTQGGKELPPPQYKSILLNWCEIKMNKQKLSISDRMNQGTFVNTFRINEIKNLKSLDFDFSKLLKLLEEVNDNYALENYYGVSSLCRAILDHIPPIFEKPNFNEVASNYGGSSLKRSFKRLNDSKAIADIHLHGQIRKKESLPNFNQIDFSQELDLLLSEIISIIGGK